MPHCGISKLVVIVAVAALVILGIAVSILQIGGGGGMAREARDLLQVRDIGGAMNMYSKKYGYFPALIDMASPDTKSIQQARTAQGLPSNLALVLLLKGEWIDDPKLFFSPRDEQPDDHTLSTMTKALDPIPMSMWPKYWAGTYAYDPGHNPNHGAVPFFGNRHDLAVATDYDTVMVLTCEMVAKELEADPSDQRYSFTNHSTGDKSTMIEDDIYADDSAKLAWRDSYLVWDVPAEVP